MDEHTFYHTRESGGTRISSAYQAASELMSREYDADLWNLYVFQFSDGDNWGDDNRRALGLLHQSLLPRLNLFCYGQVESPYGSGDFLQTLAKSTVGKDHVVLSEIADEDAIYDSIKAFLGKGK